MNNILKIFISLFIFPALDNNSGTRRVCVSKEFILSEIKRNLFLSANTKSV